MSFSQKLQFLNCVIWVKICSEISKVHLFSFFESFLKLCSQKRGEIYARLISSKELSKSELERIGKDLSDAIGSNLKFDYKIDKELIGGLKLQLGSFMIDTSIKNKLKKYEKAMLEN